MSLNALPAGHALQEYRIQKLLGVGGFGLTYLALDENLHLKVALKEYLPGEIASRTADHSIAPISEDTAETFHWGKRRFLDESRTLATFRHPNIVRVMRFFEANGSAYMVMEFVEGAPLSDWMKARGPLDEGHVTDIVKPLLDGLEVVHKAGYMHRDIKPGNIYMREDFTPVLLDFGSARMKSSEVTAVVSPGYAPFEQYHTQGNQGPWSDVYAFGGVLYWMITGNRPLEAPARVREDTMAPALQAGKGKGFRPEFLAAVDWALAPHEKDRPQSVSEWREALLGIAAAAPAAPKAPVQPQSVKAEAVTVLVAFDTALLKKMEVELAQYLGPIAAVVVKNAARKAASQPELVAILGNEISDAAARAVFQKKFLDISQPVSGTRAQVADPATALAAARFPMEVLERAEKRLAEHIGAVARVVVKRAAMKARDEAELYLLLADEISDNEKKKAFIRKALSVSGKP